MDFQLKQRGRALIDFEVSPRQAASRLHRDVEVLLAEQGLDADHLPDNIDLPRVKWTTFSPVWTRACDAHEPRSNPIHKALVGCAIEKRRGVAVRTSAIRRWFDDRYPL